MYNSYTVCNYLQQWKRRNMAGPGHYYPTANDNNAYYNKRRSELSGGDNNNNDCFATTATYTIYIRKLQNYCLFTRYMYPCN